MQDQWKPPFKCFIKLLACTVMGKLSLTLLKNMFQSVIKVITSLEQHSKKSASCYFHNKIIYNLHHYEDRSIIVQYSNYVFAVDGGIWSFFRNYCMKKNERVTIYKNLCDMNISFNIQEWKRNKDLRVKLVMMVPNVSHMTCIWVHPLKAYFRSSN